MALVAQRILAAGACRLWLRICNLLQDGAGWGQGTLAAPGNPLGLPLLI